MKIFHIGMGVMPAITRELQKLGPYRFLDWTRYMEIGQGYKELLKKDIFNHLDVFDPDLTFIHVQRDGVITPEIVQRIKGFSINYTYDVALPIPNWYNQIGEHVDSTIFCDENGVWDFKSKGFKSEFSHVGYDETVFSPIGSTGDDYSEIVFLGNHYHKEQNFELTEMRLNMVNFLKFTYGDKFKVFGNGWPYNDGNLMFRESTEAECYRSCKIAINISHFDLERYTSDRMFRLMGSGAFCLTKWYPGIEKDFKDGEHLRVWKDLNELQTLINYYLEHEDERKLIAKQGCEYVRNNFTWEHVIKRIVDMAKIRISKEYKSRVVRVQQQLYPKGPENMSLNTNRVISVEQPIINTKDPVQEETYFQPTDLVAPVHTIEFLTEIPVLQTPVGPSPPEYLKLYGERRIDYDRLEKTCYYQLINKNEVDVSIIIPVRSRSNFNRVLVKHLKQAMENFKEVTYAITIVEYSVEMEHKNLCTDVNYINVPFGGYFNKCLAFNVGAMFSNKASYYLFHDLDIIVKKNFFADIFKNLKRTGTALQTFRLRRVLYCNENLSQNIIQGRTSIEELHTKHPGITEPTLPEQMRAPGGSIFVSKAQFIQVGGYDPELFFGYSIEDQFFFDKLQLMGGISSCNDPGIEVYHLWHPPLWSSNPFLSHHHEIYQSFATKPVHDKKAFFELEKSNIQRYFK